jgi:hypothetical protein
MGTATIFATDRKPWVYAPFAATALPATEQLSPNQHHTAIICFVKLSPP